MAVIRLPSLRKSVQDKGRGRNSYTPYAHSKPPARHWGYACQFSKIKPHSATGKEDLSEGLSITEVQPRPEWLSPARFNWVQLYKSHLILFFEEQWFQFILSLLQDQRSPYWSFNSGFVAPLRRKHKDQAKEEMAKEFCLWMWIYWLFPL